MGALPITRFRVTATMRRRFGLTWRFAWCLVAAYCLTRFLAEGDARWSAFGGAVLTLSIVNLILDLTD